jgi:hypothetical protein
MLKGPLFGESLLATLRLPTLKLARALPFALILASATPQQSFALDLEFGDGEVKGSFDTTLSLGTTVRTSDRNERIVGVANGGEAFSVNGDDGNLNYDQGDVTSAVAKVTHELELQYDNFGFFGRGFYFYDTEIMDGNTQRTDLSSSAERYAGKDAKLLDLYVTGDVDVGTAKTTIRAGRQVINWGESTFIANGINTINPIDVSKLRIAGAELRDAFLPLNALDLNVSLSDQISFESFYLFEWNNTELEPSGTFLSSNDFAGPGGNTVFLGFGNPGISDNPPTLNASAPVGSGVPRLNDNNPSDQGQFGLAMRYFSPELNDTEFGLYWTRLHSRSPIISAQTGTIQGLLGGNYAQSARYFREFPEDIDTLGASFNSQVGSSGLALQGEFSYRLNQPLQVDDVELLYAALSPLNPAFGQNQLGVFGFNEEISGYRRKDIVQSQVTATQILGPWLGADQLVLIGETGGTYVVDMESQDELRYEGAGTYTSANPFFTQVGIQPGTETNGFPTQFSWGYRVVLRATYENAIGAIGLEPQIAFAADRGTTPAPLATFVNDRKTVTLSVAATYLTSYRLLLSYNDSFDGGRYNLLSDRDFVSLVASYSF